MWPRLCQWKAPRNWVLSEEIQREVSGIDSFWWPRPGHHDDCSLLPSFPELLRFLLFWNSEHWFSPQFCGLPPIFQHIPFLLKLARVVSYGLQPKKVLTESPVSQGEVLFALVNLSLRIYYRDQRWLPNKEEECVHARGLLQKTRWGHRILFCRVSV